MSSYIRERAAAARDICEIRAERATRVLREDADVIRDYLNRAHQGPAGSAQTTRIAVQALIREMRHQTELLEAELEECWQERHPELTEDAA